MIETKNNIIDLDKSEDSRYKIKVNSYNEDGRKIPWVVDYSSSKYISYNEVGIDDLILDFDLRNIKSEQYIVLKNSNGEEHKIKILPNIEESMDREYTFKVTKREVLDKNKVKLKVLSKMNKKKFPWKCSFNGRPLSYEIISTEGTITIELKSIIFGDTNGLIRISQIESNKTIEIHLTHHLDDNVEIKLINL